MEMGRLVKLAKRLPIKSLRHALKLRDRLASYGVAAIENHQQLVMRSGSSAHQSLFSRFLDPSKNQDFSVPQISAEASNLIVAGSDTTAVSLTYLIWMLLRPRSRKVKEKLLAEILPLSPDAPVTTLTQLEYLNAVISEGLRLYGAAPGSLPRVSPTGGAWIGEYYIPEGTSVSAQAYTTHRDESVFESPDR